MIGIRIPPFYLFVAVVVGHVILISAQVQTKSGVRVLEAVTFGVFSRVQGGVSGGVHGVRELWGSYIALRGARAENEALRKELAELQVRLQEQRALASRSERLQKLMDLRVTTTLPTLAAEVIAGNPNTGVRTITIDRGTADGVQENMAVIAPAGVVGRIVGPVAAHAARVQFLIDQVAAAGAVTERTRAGGMVVGAEADPPLRMDLVSNLADVKPGDLVVSSGLDGIYPKGFTIGWIATVERGSGLYLSIAVQPAVDFSGLEEVLVVMVPARPAVPEADATAAGSR